MSNPPGRYQFVFRHLTPINEVPDDITPKRNVQLQRNQSQGLFQVQPTIQKFSKTSSITKSVSTPNLQIPDTILSLPNTYQGHLENLGFSEKKGPIGQKGVQIDSKKVQNMQQQTVVGKNLISSNEKKGYQYYFKKTGSSDGRQSSPRITPKMKTQPYIRYEKYTKLNHGGFNSSFASKDAPLTRVKNSSGLEKQRSIQQLNYESSKFILQRQPSIQDKTLKPVYNFVTPSHSQVASKYPARTNVHTDRVMETTIDTSSVSKRIQQPLMQSQVGSSISQNSENGQKVDLSPKSKQFEQFFNQTMGDSRVGIREENINGQKLQHNISNVSKNLSAINDLNEIQKLNNKFKQNQDNQQTVVKVEEEVKQVVREETAKQLQESDKMSLCLQCERLRNELVKVKGQMEEVEKKRQANMDQIFRQQKTIKEIMEGDGKLRGEIGAKDKEIQLLAAQVSALNQSLSTTKAQYIQLQSLIKHQLESQISNLRISYQKQLQQSKQNIDNYEQVIRRMKEKEIQNIETAKKQHQRLIYNLNQQHQHQKSTLATKINSLQLLPPQITQLTQTIQKLQSSILQQKSVTYSTQKQLNSYKFYVERLNNEVRLVREEVLEMRGEVELKKEEIGRMGEERREMEGEVKGLKVRIEELREIGERQEEEVSKARQSYLQLSKQNEQLIKQLKSNQTANTFLNCINQLFKLYIDEQQYQTLSSKVLQLLGNSIPITQIIALVMNSTQFPSLSSQSQTSSISPSTTSHPNIRKTLKQKQSQSLILQLKSLKKQLSDAENKYSKILTQLQEKHDTLMMKQKLINTLEENVKTSQVLIVKLSEENLALEENVRASQVLIVKLSEENLELVEKLKGVEQVIGDRNEEKERLLHMIKRGEEKMKQRVGHLNETIVEMDCLKQLVEEKEKLIQQLNQKVIKLGEQLQEQSQSLSQKTQNNQQTTPFPPLQPPTTLQPLIQQLQSKDYTIQQLSTQLEESFQIIKVLKSELEQRERQFEIYQEEQEMRRAEEEEAVGQAERRDGNDERQQRHLTRKYLVKIEEYYNEVLEVFGLEEVSFNLIHSRSQQETTPNNISSKMPIPSDSLDSQQSSHKNHENPQQKNSNHPPQTQINPSQTHPIQSQHPPPFQYLLTHLSYTQQQVLRIINQWIRKLQRQSMSIHQGKERLHYIERHVKDIEFRNELLEREKLEICDKYEIFIAKLELENGIMEEKVEGMALKVVEVEGYVKELEEVLQEANSECMRSGLYALQLAKHQEETIKDLKKLYFSPYQMTVKEKDKLLKETQLLMDQKKNVTHHTCLEYLNKKLMQECIQVKEKKSYWQEFYERHNNIEQPKNKEREAVIIVKQDDIKAVDEIKQTAYSQCKALQSSHLQSQEGTQENITEPQQTVAIN